MLHAERAQAVDGLVQPDLYVGMGALGFCIYVFFGTAPSSSTDIMFTFAVVQPYIAPELKWDTNRELIIWRSLSAKRV